MADVTMMLPTAQLACSARRSTLSPRSSISVSKSRVEGALTKVLKAMSGQGCARAAGADQQTAAATQE